MGTAASGRARQPWCAWWPLLASSTASGQAFATRHLPHQRTYGFVAIPFGRIFVHEAQEEGAPTSSQAASESASVYGVGRHSVAPDVCELRVG
jgi:hypothetical protein